MDPKEKELEAEKRTNKIAKAIQALRVRRPNSMPLGFFTSPYSSDYHLWSACPDGDDFVLAVTNVEDGLTHEMGFDAPASQLIKIMCAETFEAMLKASKNETT